MLILASILFAAPTATHLVNDASVGAAARMTRDGYVAVVKCPTRSPDLLRLLTRDDILIEGDSLTKRFCDGGFAVTDEDRGRSSFQQITAPRYVVADLEAAVLRKVNVERVAHSQSPLQRDDALSAVARLHSSDMASSDYVEHVNLDGLTPTDRANAAGYSCRKDYEDHYTDGVAENILQTWLFESTTYIGPAGLQNYQEVEELAGQAVTAWMESAGYRQNILNPNYDRVGTGLAVTPSDKVYITQNFC